MNQFTIVFVVIVLQQTANVFLEILIKTFQIQTLIINAYHFSGNIIIVINIY